MKINQQMINLFAALFLSTAFIFSCAFFGTQAAGLFQIAKESSQTSTNSSQPKKQTVQAASNKMVVLSTASVTLGQMPEELQAFLSSHIKIEIPAQSTFSFIDFTKKDHLDYLDSDTLSLLASGMYQAILPTNFTIAERNISSSLPASTKLGFEARVDLGRQLDLAFTNPNQTNCVIQLQLNQNKVTFTVEGQSLPNDYQIITTGEQYLQPKTILQYSPLLLSGQIAVTSAGADGQVINVYRNVFQGETLIKSELISNDYYPPEYRVEVHPLDGTQIAPVAGTPQTGTSTGQPTGSGNQTGQTTTGNGSQTNQTATGSQTAASSSNSSTAAASSDNSIWGIPNEPSK